MAKILTFRNKDGGPSDQDFLTDENQTLSFRTTEDGGISLGDLSGTGLSDLFPDPKKDWSNQELADLFRVRQLLSGANVAVETDRGVTDEGDPWFVFCHANGEVFIHLCRIDGLYLLDSPNVLRPLRGADFNELIADFTNQSLPARDTADGAEHRVIKLERGGKVRLHPSAMLAALIWTLFLASEELVLLAPEEQALDEDALLDFEGMFAVDPVEDAQIDIVFEDDTVDVASFLKDDVHDADHASPEAQGQLREVMLQQQSLTVHNNAFTMGLSTIAIAMGFMSETVLLENQRKVLESLKQLGFSEYGEDAQSVAELDIPADEDGSALLAMLADFLGLDLSLNTDLADNSALYVSPSALQQDMTHLAESITVDAIQAEVDTPSGKAITLAAVRKKEVAVEEEVSLEGIHTEDEETLLQPQVDDTLITDTIQEATKLALSEIVQAWQADTENYEIVQTFEASFIAQASVFELFAMVDTTPQGRVTDFRLFDDHAQSFIDYLESKEGEFVVYTRGSKLLMIDTTAVTGGEIEYVHWETSDGIVIALVGLASDFEQFDMIA